MVSDSQMRIKALKSALADARFDAYLVTSVTSVYYFTGFLDIKDAPITLLVPVDQEPILYVSGLSYVTARDEAKNCIVKPVRMGEQFPNKILKELSMLRVRRVGFEALPAHSFLKFSKALKDVRFDPAADLVWKFRKIKSDAEIAHIRRAAAMADVGIKTAREILKPGISECEVAAEAEYAMRSIGSEAFAFDTIVVSGSRSAMPHGSCSTKKINLGDLVTIDLGAVYHGYRSDITRTMVVGKPSPKQTRIFNLVLNAQERAFKAIKAGAKAWQIDAIARRIINRGGYGKYFIHGLGHGVGLDIHEPPRLGPKSRDVLSRGNVITNEPGVYIPRFGGVRIEDTVLVHRNRAERLTQSPHEPIED